MELSGEHVCSIDYLGALFSWRGHIDNEDYGMVNKSLSAIVDCSYSSIH